MTYTLGWVNETEGEKDADGNVIPGSERAVFVLMDLPPGLDDAGKRNREAIKRACKKAVFELGMEEYGNKKLVVVCYDDSFQIDFERVTVTKLMTPEKAETVRAANGKDVEPDEDPEADDDDDDDDDDDGDDGDEAEV